MRHAHRRHGFSLLEMMLVVVIIGLLAGVVMFNFVGQGTTARVATTKAKLRTIKNAVDTFIVEKGSVPSSLLDLTAGNSPYLERVADDSWDNEFVFIPGNSQFANRRYTLYSLGEDGLDGTEDDIDVWTMEDKDDQGA